MKTDQEIASDAVNHDEPGGVRLEDWADRIGEATDTLVDRGYTEEQAANMIEQATR